MLKTGIAQIIIALLAWGLLESAPVRAADIQFDATVDRTELGLGETLTLTFQVQGAGMSVPRPRFPDLSDFRVVSGPNEASNFQFINGQTSSSKTFTLVLQPLREGTATIGSAELTYDKRLYSTDPIAVTVVGAVTSPPQAPTPDITAPTPRGSDADLFVQVSADKDQVYQNEQLILTYTIYTRVSVSAYEISKLPNLPGFWAEEFPSPPQGPEVRDVVVGGSHYRAAVIRRVALFPTQTGELRIDPLEVTCQVQMQDSRRRRRDPFDMLFEDPFARLRTETRMVATDPLKVKVSPLPATDKPADFSGAVGDFKLDVSLDRTAAQTNEALTMTVRYSGKGNIKMLPPPYFKAPSDFESYEPKESVQVNKSAGTVSGAKTYEYVLIPRFAGKHKIPPLTFSFFDPQRRSYQTLSAGGFEIAVEPGSSAPITAIPGISKEAVKLLGEDIQYLKSVGRLRPAVPAARLPRSYWLGMILPPILAGLFLAASRLSGAAPIQARRRARRAYSRGQRDLRQLDKIAASSPSMHDRFARFYSGAHNALIGYLGEKLQLPARGLKEDDVLEQMQKHNLPVEQLSEIRDILNTCNFARFASGSEDASAMNQLVKRLRSLMENLEAMWEKAA